MKVRLTVTIDEETDLQIREQLRKEAYIRNKSHFVDVALKEFLKGRSSQ